MQDEKSAINDEVALINAARTDPEAFGQLYERYVERIYNYIYFRVGGAGDAEDLTARVFFKALRGIGGYRHMGLPFSAWLYRIAHNLVANYHRDRSRMQEISIENLVVEDTSKSSAPEHLMETRQENDFLLALINDLSPQKKELIILKYVQKLSNEEIGQIFGKTEGAIKSLYHRTLVELKERAKQNNDARIF
ncbi:MAG: sigma-70 family RNA polymerase sigma factor [Chloroflexi bacterium]|nr:sigma-70 family RNA polymerase sigma factor [Chloroflexota bacterium]